MAAVLEGEGTDGGQGSGNVELADRKAEAAHGQRCRQPPPAGRPLPLQGGSGEGQAHGFGGERGHVGHEAGRAQSEAGQRQHDQHAGRRLPPGQHRAGQGVGGHQPGRGQDGDRRSRHPGPRAEDGGERAPPTGPGRPGSWRPSRRRTCAPCARTPTGRAGRPSRRCGGRRKRGMRRPGRRARRRR